jgi:hypothetical protein
MGSSSQVAQLGQAQWRVFPGQGAKKGRVSLSLETLTKMNWNNTQFDGALPITMKAARQVGDILKYVPEGQAIDPRYRFYM